MSFGRKKGERRQARAALVGNRMVSTEDEEAGLLEGCGGLRKTYHLLGAATYTIQSPEIQRTIIRGDVAQSLLENFTGFRSLEMSCFHKLEA